MPFKLNEIEVFLITYPNYPEEKQITDLKFPKIETIPIIDCLTSFMGRIFENSNKACVNLMH